MDKMFQLDNETATEENKRLKNVLRKSLVESLDASVQRVREVHKDLPIEFLVQCRPFSTNKMSGRSKTFETKHYLAFRELIAKVGGGCYGINGKEKFRLRLIAAFSNKKGDLDNCFKPLLDSIVGSVDKSFDDSQVYEIVARKRVVKKGQEYIQVRLEIIDEEEYKQFKWDL